MGIGKTLSTTFKLPPKVAKPVIKAEPSGVPPHYDFEAIYSAWLWKQANDPVEKAKNGRLRGVFHPSSGLHPDSGLCERALMFELVCAPFSASNILVKICKVMDNGTSRHSGFQANQDKMAAAHHMGVVGHDKEVMCRHHTLPIYGHMDGIWYMEGGWKYAYDLKTWSTANCAKTFEPAWGHKLQLMTYMGIKGIRAGYMIYENKDSQEWLKPLERFRVNFDPKLYAQIEQYCSDVLKETVAEKMPAFNEKVCKANLMFCAFVEVCDKQRAGAGWASFDKRTEEQRRTHLQVFQ